MFFFTTQTATIRGAVPADPSTWFPDNLQLIPNFITPRDQSGGRCPAHDGARQCDASRPDGFSPSERTRLRGTLFPFSPPRSSSTVSSLSHTLSLSLSLSIFVPLLSSPWDRWSRLRTVTEKPRPRKKRKHATGVFSICFSNFFHPIPRADTSISWETLEMICKMFGRSTGDSSVQPRCGPSSASIIFFHVSKGCRGMKMSRLIGRVEWLFISLRNAIVAETPWKTRFIRLFGLITPGREFLAFPS